jgi:hypothetical protein
MIGDVNATFEVEVMRGWETGNQEMTIGNSTLQNKIYPNFHDDVEVPAGTVDEILVRYRIDTGN